MSRRLMLAAVASLALTVSSASGGTPLGGDDTGFVPPDAQIKRCEEAVVPKAASLIRCVVQCHIKTADLAVKGSTFDEEGCEQECLFKFASKIDVVLARQSCAPCTGEMAPGIMSGTEGFADAINGDIYCAPGAPFG